MDDISVAGKQKRQSAGISRHRGFKRHNEEQKNSVGSIGIRKTFARIEGSGGTDPEGRTRGRVSITVDEGRRPGKESTDTSKRTSGGGDGRVDRWEQSGGESIRSYKGTGNVSGRVGNSSGQGGTGSVIDMEEQEHRSAG